MLKIAKNLELPMDFATQTVAILARKRVGKTYTASVIAEECCENKIPFVVLDPTGAWYGLRSSADGKSAGYPVIIIGGAHGDIPLEFTAGKLIAEFVVENPGYYVLDLSGSESDAEQDRFATAFAQRLYRIKDKHREPLHLFVDEADSFAPQRPLPGQQVMLGAFEAIVRRGGIRGIGITMITQRPAVLNKNVLTQSEVIIALQTTGPQDIDAVDDWIKLNATPEQRVEFKASIASLGQGEAYVWSPAWLDIFKRVNIRTRRTFNSSATPKVGEKKVEPKKLADVDLDALRASMSATIDKVNAQDPKKLQAEIRRLQTELAKKPPAEIQAAAEPVKVEIPVFPLGLKAELVGLRGELISLGIMADEIKVKVTGIREFVDGTIKKSDDFRPDFTPKTPGSAAPEALRHAVQNHSKPRPAINSQAAVINGDFRLNKKQQEILDAIAWWESIGITSPTTIQIGAVALVDPSGGHFSNLVGPLSSNGLVERGSGQMRLTDAGRTMATVPETGSTLSEYHDVLRNRVRRMKQASGRTVDVLNAIIAAGGNSITTEKIGEAVKIDHTGGHFSNTIGPLSTAGLITRGGGVVYPTDVLFPEGLS